MRPVHLVFVSTGADPAACGLSQELDCRGRWGVRRTAETFLSVPGEVHLTNAVTEIVAGANATVDYYKMERESRDRFPRCDGQSQLGP